MTASTSHAGYDAGPRVALRLVNGNAITGRLITRNQHTGAWVLAWKGGAVSFAPDEIREARILPPGSAPAGDGIVLKPSGPVKNWWPYTHNPVIRLKNGQTVDAAILSLDEDAVVARRAESGGSVECRLAKSEVKAVEYEGVTPVESAAAQESLGARFPALKRWTQSFAAPERAAVRASLNPKEPSIVAEHLRQMRQVALDMREILRQL